MINERELLEDVLSARSEVDGLNTQLTLAKEKKEETEKKLIERMDLTDKKSMKIQTNQGLVGVVRKENLYVSCKKEDKDGLLVWVDETCGRPDLIKRTIHNKTLESFVKQRLKDGEAVPAFIALFPRPVLAITKA